MLLLKITKFFPHCYIQAPSARVGGGVAPNPRPLPEIRFQLCRYSARGLLISPGISLTDLNRYRYSGSARLLSSIIHKLVDFSSLSLSVSQSLSPSVPQSLSLSDTPHSKLYNRIPRHWNILFQNLFQELGQRTGAKNYVIASTRVFFWNA